MRYYHTSHLQTKNKFMQTFSSLYRREKKMSIYDEQDELLEEKERLEERLKEIEERLDEINNYLYKEELNEREREFWSSQL